MLNEQNVNLVANYLREHQMSTLIDISQALKMKSLDVAGALTELMERGVVGRTELRYFLK